MAQKIKFWYAEKYKMQSKTIKNVSNDSSCSKNLISPIGFLFLCSQQFSFYNIFHKYSAYFNRHINLVVTKTKSLFIKDVHVNHCNNPL